EPVHVQHHSRHLFGQIPLVSFLILLFQLRTSPRLRCSDDLLQLLPTVLRDLIFPIQFKIALLQFHDNLRFSSISLLSDLPASSHASVFSAVDSKDFRKFFLLLSYLILQGYTTGFVQNQTRRTGTQERV